MKSIPETITETAIGAAAIGGVLLVLLLIIMTLDTIIVNRVLLPTIILVLLSWITGKKIFEKVDKKNKERGF